MAATAMDYENANPDRYEDEGPRYERDRSASPRAGDMRDDSHEPMRRRSPSPVGDRDRAKDDDKADDNSINPGSNLFVTGIHPSLKEDEIIRLFEKYGEVEKCQIMRDPHSQESRGFGFVKMVTSDQANAARDALQGEVIEGRTLSIEKARRVRPRTPTPGKYFGPPKRGDDRRFGERRRGPYGSDFRGGSRAFGGGGRDDSYRGGGYRDEPRGGAAGYRDDQRSFRDEPRYESRGYRDEPRYRDDRDRRDDYPRGGDRFERDRYRDDRYGGERDRRGGYNDREGGRPRDGGSTGAGAYSDNRDSRDTYGRAPSSVKPSGNDNN